jgi:hypothetical protein
VRPKKFDEFLVSNDICQGGVLSPILFTVYIDDLLLELERQGIGCYWLLAPSPSALRLMLNTCSFFATSHNLIFNVIQLLRFFSTPESLPTSFSSVGATFNLLTQSTPRAHPSF